jgi:cyclophilin family peptidyl-prolyl cis-trans isomerase
MRLHRSLSALAALSLSPLAFAQAEQPAAPAAQTAPAKEPAPVAAMEYAVIKTTKGDIVVELDRAKAPITVENFVTYIKDGFFDGTVFHRIVPGFVIQGGGFTPKGEQKKTRAPIANEWQNGLKNKRGTLSMARTNNPNSASSQFFISLKDNDALDQPISGGAGYAVFGRVVVGMDVVDSIARSPRGSRGPMQDWPVEDVVMMKVEMLAKAEADKLVEAAANAAKPAPASPAAPSAPAAPANPAEAAPAAPKKEG